MPNQTPIDWTKPADEILADLLADVWVPTNAAITVAEIVNAVGTDAARLVVGTLQQGAGIDPLLASSWQAISTVGMSLSGQDRQQMIDELAIGGEWPDAVRDAVKALGGVWVGRWSLEGFESEPSLTQVNARKASVALGASQKAANQQIEEIKFTADAAAFGVGQEGGDGPAMIAAWVAAVNGEVAGG